MIIVHHLENSRSQRVLWLLEELGLEYDVRRYERDPRSGLAPPELARIHPSGKSPVVEDRGVVYAETGAIVEHLLETYGDGRLVPTNERASFRYWMHAAEGSYMPPLVLALILGRMETAPMPFFVRPIARRLTGAVRSSYLDHTIEALFGHLVAALADKTWLCGDEFSGADIMMSFPIEAGRTRVPFVRKSQVITDYLARLHARPAWARALERGGPYSYA